MVRGLNTLKGLFVGEQNQIATLTGLIMSNTKRCIKHASDSEIFQCTNWRKLQMNVCIGLCKSEQLVGLWQRLDKPPLISPLSKDVDAWM